MKVIIKTKDNVSSWGLYTKQLRKLSNDELVSKFQETNEYFKKYGFSAIIRCLSRIEKVLKERNYDINRLYDKERYHE